MKTKILAGLAFAAFMTVGSASATSVEYVAGLCGTFNNNYPNAPITGTWTCPTSASLGVPLADVADETVVYSASFSNGLTGTDTTVTNFTFSGAGFMYLADTVTTPTGAPGSAATPVSSDGLTYMGSINLPPLILPGFWDSVTSPFGTPTVNYTNTTVGATAANTGYAEVIYSYCAPLGSGDTCENGGGTGGTPEPASMLLLGGGLLGLSIIGRRKFARKQNM